MTKNIAIAFVISLIIIQSAIIFQLKTENERCDRYAKKVEYTRDSVWLAYNPWASERASKWFPGTPIDSTDSGPLTIKTDQVKDGTIVKSKVRHYGEPKDSIYGVSFFPSPPNTDKGCKVGAWVDLKRNAIYKIMWGDSVYYVTRVIKR